MLTESAKDEARLEEIVIIRHLKTVTLDRQNYFAWRMQFATVLRGNELEDYLTREIELNTSVRLKQDRLILGWIMMCIAPDILPELIGCKTANEAWSALQDEFASSSRSQVINLRQKLQIIRKGGRLLQNTLQKLI